MPKRRSSVIKYLVLASLVSRGELHGYALYKEILYHVEQVWRPSIGTFYRVLSEMVKSGLIERRVSSGRTIYAITSTGLEALVNETLPHTAKMASILTQMLKAYSKLPNRNRVLSNPAIKDRLEVLKKTLMDLEEWVK